MKLSQISSSKDAMYPEDWPPQQYHIRESDLKNDVVDGFQELINRRASETVIDRYLSLHPELLTAVLDINNTGHHAAWVIPKKSIRAKVSDAQPGLIPDFLVGGKNSFGITWYIVELKGAAHTLFSEKNNKIQLSQIANRGVCQILEYMSFCNTAQAYLRDAHHLKGFEHPKGYLFIGNESETESNRKRDLKSAINNMSANLQIRSYDALLRSCYRITSSNEKKGV